MERFSALIGFVAILLIAYLLSTNRRAIRWRTVGWGLLLQIVTAVLVLKGALIASKLAGIAPAVSRAMASIVFIVLAIIFYWVAKRLDAGTRRFVWGVFGVVTVYLFLSYNLLAYLFENLKDVVNHLIEYTAAGSAFVFGPLGDPASKSIGFFFAFRGLPTIIFIASIFAVLYYVGAMQLMVRVFAKIMTRFTGASRAESTSVAASIFMGQTEAPLTIRPFLADMTISELMTIMTSGMAHVSGGIMAAYIAFGIEPKHLLSAVIMTAPGTIMISKMLVPETEHPKTAGRVVMSEEEEVVRKRESVLSAVARGTTDG